MSDSSSDSDSDSDSSSSEDLITRDRPRPSSSPVRWSVTFNIQQDLRTAVDCRSAPFDSGHWVVRWAARSGTLTLEWKDVNRPARISSLGGVVQRVSSGSAPAAERHNLADWAVGHGVFPEATSGRLCQLFKPKKHDKLYVLTLSFSPTKGDGQVLPASQIARAEPCQAAAARALASYAPNDVVFYFPRTKRELWANSRTLRECSPYLQTLLDSGFREAHPPDLQVQSADADQGADPHRRCDSDDETDESPVETATARPRASRPPGVRQITITQAAYTTYRAVLVWYLTNCITFAALGQHASPATPTAERPSKRARLDAGAATVDPDLPQPASPKSVYMLAHLLELPELMGCALDNFKSQLTVDNALYQLASDIALHDEVKDAITAFAKANWPAVKASKAATELSKAEVLESLGCGVEFGARLMELVSKC